MRAVEDVECVVPVERAAHRPLHGGPAGRPLADHALSGVGSGAKNGVDT